MASISKQDTYRLLMKDKKAKRSTVPKIDHPLAKYNSIGQLTCVICEAPVKSDLLWQTHIKSKIHKQNVDKLKLLNKPQPSSSNHQPTSLSTRTASTDDDGFVKPSMPLSRKRHRSITEEEKEEEVDKTNGSSDKEEVVQVSAITKTEGLPSDFFDASTSGTDKPNSVITESKKESKDDKNFNQSNLPEGFFDNPVADAKVRKVEYKDPLDDQWEAFQKSISKESDVSEAIVENDDEEMKVDRELTEVKEQVHCYERAEKLRLKQEVLFVSKDVKNETPDEKRIKEEEEEDDEADLTDLLNWRFKSS